MAMRQFGKFLQVAALIILPVGMLLELFGVLGRSYGLAEMLKLLLAGIVVFSMGRIIEGYASPRK